MAAAFRAAGLDAADLDARILVCAACGLDHAGLTRDPDLPLGESANVLTGYLERRLARTPVSRILGRREFWGLDLAIGPEVLDPRPETEGLVASMIDAVGGRRSGRLDMLDLGTGSGAILCALLSELPAARGIGVDRSAAACRIARGNIEALGLAGRATIVCTDWTDGLTARFDLVAANPPYVATGDLAGLSPEVRCHDPLGALDGGPDGLDAYRALVPRLRGLLKKDGIAAFECGHDQGQAVATMMREAGLAGVMVYKDLAGLDRVILGLRA